MRPASPKIHTDIVLLGAGHAHVAVLRAFGMSPVPGVRLTLITRQADTPYSGMLPGLIAGTYTFDDAHIDTAPLAAFAGARLYQDEAIGIDPQRRLVKCRERGDIVYDVLSVDIGSTPNNHDTPGAAEHAIPVKPIDGFLRRFEACIERLASLRRVAAVTVVGAGAGGIELVFALDARFRRELTNPPIIALVCGAAEILPGFSPGARKRTLEALRRRGINVCQGVRAASVAEASVTLSNGETLASDATFWTARAAAPPWLRETGLPLDRDGFLKTGADLRVQDQDAIFSAGDVASFTPRALPKSGVYAVRAGPVLAENLRRLALSMPLQPFKPQGDAMYLLSTADGSAIGTRNGLSFQGKWVWRWKDWIDRRFMDRFGVLPEMRVSLAKDEDDTMRCGACGAKVGAAVLAEALSGLRPVTRPEIISGLNAPDDAAIIDNGGGELVLHSVDYFRSGFDDPFLFGKIAANHAMSDIFAMGGAPKTALAIATLPYGSDAKTSNDLRALMAGANAALSEAACALIGGHTSEGTELALGFAVTGTVAAGRALRKSGLRPGDALILTKPLGSGIILAAHMRRKAKARVLFAAFDSLVQSNRRASEIMQAHGARAATDVTGFGLAGHLLEMLDASKLGARLDLAAIPALDGARGLADEGIVSSMAPANARAAARIANAGEYAGGSMFGLLFDPQTAGGLLFGLEASRAVACVAALRAAGYGLAARIGAVEDEFDLGKPLRIAQNPA